MIKQAAVLFSLTLITMALLSRVVFGNSSVPLCRLQDELLPEMEFQRVSCSRCYKYMHESNFKPNLKAKLAENMGLTIGNITVSINQAINLRLIYVLVERETFNIANTKDTLVSHIHAPPNLKPISLTLTVSNPCESYDRRPLEA
jgi:hypothetical protein